MATVSGGYRPVTPAALADSLAGLLEVRRPGHPLRVGIDGPVSAQPEVLAQAVAERVHAAGRTAVVVDAATFWRDASLRYEFGRTDVDAYYERWLDVGALNREVLDRCASGSFLPALRDPTTNRTTRLPYQALDSGAVVVVAGQLLLGNGLSFDLTVHLATSSAARARRTPAGQAWTLPAFDRYEHEVHASDIADVVVSANDPVHPAIRMSPGS